MTLKNKLVFLDFETTGINVFDSDPIQIGAVYVDEKLRVINTFSSYIRPHITSRMKVSSKETHGLKINELMDKPTDKEVLKEYFKIIGTDYSFAGWNISFDIPYFRKMCHRTGNMREFNNINYRHIDVQTIVRLAAELYLIPRNINSLDDCITFFNLIRKEKHDALDDAKVTFVIFKTILERFQKNLKI